MARPKKPAPDEIEHRVYTPEPDTKPLEKIIEEKLRRILATDSEPDKNTLTAINTAIKFVAVQHKISEAQWGENFMKDDPEDEEDGTDRNESGGKAG
jgi:hypothetical protein